MKKKFLILLFFAFVSVLSIAACSGNNQNTSKGIQGPSGTDGKDGADGKSAYDIWVDEGHEGSEADFLDWLRGANQQCIVTFKSDGEIVDTLFVKRGEKMEKPADHQKDGYIFDGWYVSDNDFSQDNKWSFIGYIVTEDMTLYANFTPEALPSLALIIVIDCSASMTLMEASGKTRLERAKEAAIACLDILNESDYVGIISFNSVSKVEVPLTSLTQKSKIIQAIVAMSATGGTSYVGAVQSAGSALQEFTDADRKLVIFFSDGEPLDSPNAHEPLINNYSTMGIEWSFVALIDDAILQNFGERFIQVGKGRLYFTLDSFIFYIHSELERFSKE